MAGGSHSKKNVWDAMAAYDAWRDGEKLDPGVNYFVFMLDQLGFPTFYSCEGHPSGFYISFRAPYEEALRIQKIGYFSVEIEGEDYWSIRNHMEREGERDKRQALRWAAQAWEEALGPLDVESVEIQGFRKA